MAPLPCASLHSLDLPGPDLLLMQQKPDCAFLCRSRTVLRACSCGLYCSIQFCGWQQSTWSLPAGNVLPGVNVWFVSSCSEAPSGCRAHTVKLPARMSSEHMLRCALAHVSVRICILVIAAVARLAHAAGVPTIKGGYSRPWLANATKF